MPILCYQKYGVNNTVNNGRKAIEGKKCVGKCKTLFFNVVYFILTHCQNLCSNNILS